MSDWYSKGVDAAQKARKQIGSGFRPDFWLKADTSAEIVVLDKEPFNVWQHSFQVRGKWKTYTCLRKNCPLCRVNEPRFFAVYRILDLREYVDKSGKKHKNQERYYAVSPKNQPIFERLLKKGILYKHVLEVARVGAGNTAVYNFVPMGKPKFEVPKPKLDTLKDFAPKNKDELLVILEVLGVSVDDEDEQEEEPEANTRKYSVDDDDDGEEEEEDGDDGEDDEDSSDASDEAEEDGDDDEEDEEDTEEDADEDEEDDEPVAKKKPAKKKKKPVVDDDDEE